MLVREKLKKVATRRKEVPSKRERPKDLDMPEVTGKKRLGQEERELREQHLWEGGGSEIQHDRDRHGLGAGKALVVFRQFKGDGVALSSGVQSVMAWTARLGGD